MHDDESDVRWKPIKVCVGVIISLKSSLQLIQFQLFFSVIVDIFVCLELSRGIG